MGKIILFEIKKIYRLKKNVITSLLLICFFIISIFLYNSIDVKIRETEKETLTENIRSKAGIVSGLKKKDLKIKENMYLVKELELLKSKQENLDEKSWREGLKANIKLNKLYIEMINKGIEVGEPKEKLEENITVEKLLLKNDIKPINVQTSVTPFNFTRVIFTEKFFIMLTMIIFMLSADCISLENEMGTFKFLLMQPVKRTKVIMGKIIAYTTAISSIILTTMIFIFLGLGIWKGFSDYNYPIRTLLNNVEATFTPLYIINIKIIILLLLYICFCVSLGVIISNLVENSSTSIGISLLITIIIYVITYILKPFKSIAYLNPFIYGSFSSVIEGYAFTSFFNGKITYVNGIIVLLIYSIILYFLNIVIFKNKDIKS